MKRDLSSAISSAISLKGRSLTDLHSFTREELLFLLRLAADLKQEKASGTEKKRLEGKNIVLLFQKDSTRTRCAFEVGARDQGAGVTFIGPEGSHMGAKESVKDTARVLGRMYDGIEFRGFKQETVEELALYAGVPVWNGLTDEWHPTQALADVMTMQEHARRLEGSGESPGTFPPEKISFAYVGDARNNMGHSLLITGALLGMDVRIAAPSGYLPAPGVRALADKLAADSGASVLITEDPLKAVRGTGYVHTDVWVSMGEPEEVWAERSRIFRPYRVDQDLMKAASPEACFMHCLPSFHNTETRKGQELARKFGGIGRISEVSDAVFESPSSLVFDQAENRLHSIKAVITATLADSL